MSNAFWTLNVARLVHDDVQNDAFERDRHASFIRTQLLGSVLAVTVFTAFYLFAQPTGMAVLIACALFLSAACLALYVSMTGRLAPAQFLSALTFAGVIGLVAWFTGGASSFAVLWLALIPLEAALSRDAAMMRRATCVAVAAFALLAAATLLRFVPPVATLVLPLDVLALISTLMAILYAGGLVASVQGLHRASQAKLEHSQDHYRIIAECTSDLIIKYDPDGATVFVSRAARELFGCGPAAIMREGLGAHLGDIDRRRFERMMDACRQGGVRGRADVELEPRETIEGARAQFVEVRCEALGEGEGPHEVLLVASDITRRKARELDGAAQRQAAQRAHAENQRFIATMTHELRTPLNAIIGFSEFLHRELLIRSRQPEHAEYCQLINDSGTHLLQIVNNLLDVSKLQAGKYEVICEPFDPRPDIKAAVAMVQAANASRALVLETDVEGSIDELSADRRAFKQILLNVLSNAAKFSHDGGLVRVALRAAAGPDGASGTVLQVIDAGIGIEAAAVARLGEPFYQADGSYRRRHEGTGLGLSIVKGLVALHDGTFAVRSTPGEGTTVSVWLPEAQREHDGAGMVARGAATGVATGTGTGPATGVAAGASSGALAGSMAAANDEALRVLGFGARGMAKAASADGVRASPARPGRVGALTGRSKVAFASRARAG